METKNNSGIGNYPPTARGLIHNPRFSLYVYIVILTIWTIIFGVICYKGISDALFDKLYIVSQIAVYVGMGYTIMMELFITLKNKEDKSNKKHCCKIPSNSPIKLNSKCVTTEFSNQSLATKNDKDVINLEKDNKLPTTLRSGY